MAATFPFVAVTSGRGDASLLPLLPLKLWLKGGQPIQSQGLLDSGAAVNVLPFELGVRLGGPFGRLNQPE